MTDTYTIKFSSDADGSIPGATVKTQFTVGPTVTDTTSTSLTIHGKDSVPFGEDLWTNLVHLLENFCSAQGPAHSTLGQLWFDTTIQALKVRRVISTSPYQEGWAPISPFNGSSSLLVPLITTLANNNIIDDTSTYDNYFVTKSYSDAHYLPRGNFVSGTDALSKYKLKYSTDVTFVSGDTTALVTKKYVDDLVGIVDTLSIDVQVDGSMIATKAFIGSLDNFIPAAGNVPSGNTPVYDNYFVTRGYADQRYLREGVFDNDVRRISASKIKYTSDAIYSAPDDDYTLVHRKFVTEYVATAVSGVGSTPTWLNVTTQPGLGVLWSDGTNPISNIPISPTNTSGQVLAINSSKDGFEWITPPVPNNLPSWASTTPTGVLIGNGTTVSGLSSTVDKRILATKVTGANTTYEWSSLSDVGAVAIPSDAGFLYSNGTAISSSKGGNDTFLTINSSGNPFWMSKADIATYIGAGSSSTSTWGLKNYLGTHADLVNGRDGYFTYTNTGTGPRLVMVVVGNTGEYIPFYMWDPLTPNNRIIVGTTSMNVLQNIDFMVPPGWSYQYNIGPRNTATPNNTGHGRISGTVTINSNDGSVTTGTGNGEIRAWAELDMVLASSSGSSGSSGSATVPSKGLVTSNGTALISKSLGTNGYLLASDTSDTTTGLKWVDPSTLGGGGTSLAGAINAMAAHEPSSKTLPSTQSTEKNGTQNLFHDGSNSSYTLSAPTGLLTLTIPPVQVDTPVCITTGYKTAFTGSAPICLHYLYVDINGASIRKVSSSETFMTTLKAGTSYTINLVGQYTCALGNLSTAVATVADMFIEVVAPGQSLSTGSGSSTAVKMVKNTVATKTIQGAWTNILSITIPATNGTPVEYWVTGGIGNVSVGAQATCALNIAIKNGSTVLTQSIVNTSSEGWSGSFSITSAATPITLNLAAVSNSNALTTAAYNYLSATPITSL